MRVRTRRAVALHYFGGSDARIAVEALSRWIKSDTDFRLELESVGYRPRVRTFTPRQMEVVRKYLGKWG